MAMADINGLQENGSDSPTAGGMMGGLTGGLGDAFNAGALGDASDGIYDALGGGPKVNLKVSVTPQKTQNSSDLRRTIHMLSKPCGIPLRDPKYIN